MSQAKKRIFEKLRQAKAQAVNHPDTNAYYQQMGVSWDNDIERLRHWAETMRSVKTDIVWVTEHNWLEKLAEIINTKQLKNVALPNNTDRSIAIQGALPYKTSDTKYTVINQTLENCKNEFFNDIDAGFTEVRGGIAQTGTLLLWTSEQEPRSLSLIPPTHIALFDTRSLYNDFYNAMQDLSMPNNMPSNVVLVSGPSKTADIQLTLAYGAHGPKDLTVLAILPPNIDEKLLNLD